MNPLKLLKIYRKANRVASLLEDAQVSKSLFKSRTFWVNLLTAGAELAGIIPLPPGTTLLIVSGINIALRVLTQGPVHVIEDAAK